MDPESVNTRVLHMAPVTEDTQLHESMHHVTRALRTGGGVCWRDRREKNRRKVKAKYERSRGKKIKKMKKRDSNSQILCILASRRDKLLESKLLCFYLFTVTHGQLKRLR